MPIHKNSIFHESLCCRIRCLRARTTDTQWRHKPKKSEILGRCGRQNVLWQYLKIWDWDLIFGCAMKAFSSLGVWSPRFRIIVTPCFKVYLQRNFTLNFSCSLTEKTKQKKIFNCHTFLKSSITVQMGSCLSSSFFSFNTTHYTYMTYKEASAHMCLF